MGEPYIKLYDWMLTISGLSLRDVHAYAIVYGYTEKGQAYKGTASSLARRLSCSEQTARRSVHLLIEKGLLVRSEDGLTAQNRAQKRSEMSAETLNNERETAQNRAKNAQNRAHPYIIEYPICNQGSNQDSIHPRTGPTEDEIKRFCQETGLTHVDPASFFAHYEARDWQTETGPVRNWQRLVAKWDEQLRSQAGKKRQSGKSNPQAPIPGAEDADRQADRDAAIAELFGE